MLTPFIEQDTPPSDVSDELERRQTFTSKQKATAFIMLDDTSSWACYDAIIVWSDIILPVNIQPL